MGHLIQFVLSYSVMSDSLWLRGLQPARLLCPWGFSSQEYWNGLPCPPGELPDPGIEPGSPALQADSLPVELFGERYLSQVLKIALGWTGRLSLVGWDSKQWKHIDTRDWDMTGMIISFNMCHSIVGLYLSLMDSLVISVLWWSTVKVSATVDT